MTESITTYEAGLRFDTGTYLPFVESMAESVVNEDICNMKLTKPKDCKIVKKTLVYGLSSGYSFEVLDEYEIEE
jgi:hypothetical protein